MSRAGSVSARRGWAPTLAGGLVLGSLATWDAARGGVSAPGWLLPLAILVALVAAGVLTYLVTDGDDW